jgi:hypothetical protein
MKIYSNELGGSPQRHDGATPEALHAMPASAVAAMLGVDTADGLATAAVDERRTRFGANVIPDPPRRSRLLRFLDQFNNPFIYICWSRPFSPRSSPIRSKRSRSSSS